MYETNTSTTPIRMKHPTKQGLTEELSDESTFGLDFLCYKNSFILSPFLVTETIDS